jgi:hypothetical protein
MAHRHRRPGGVLAVVDVEIGAADAGRHHGEDDVPRGRGGLGAVGEIDVADPGSELRQAAQSVRPLLGRVESSAINLSRRFDVLTE